MVPKRSMEVLSGVPKTHRAVTCLTEKIQVLDNLPSGLGYDTVGHNLMLVNQQYIFNKVS